MNTMQRLRRRRIFVFEFPYVVLIERSYEMSQRSHNFWTDINNYDKRVLGQAIKNFNQSQNFRTKRQSGMVTTLGPFFGATKN